MNPQPLTADGFHANRALNQAFRHSSWVRRREATGAVFRELEVPQARLVRFLRCGDSAWVLRDPDHAYRVRLATNACRDRWCDPCLVERRRIISWNVATALEGKQLRLLTLTLRSTADPLIVQLRRLLNAFRRFRQAKAVSKCLTGGIYFIEITLNTRTNLWHPHLHVIWEGSYLPHPVAKATWQHITEDSFIVDLRPLNGSKAAASYVAKYAGKAIDRHVWTNHDRFVEAIRALNGRRTFSQFGTWRDLDLSKSPTDDTHWEVLMPLHEMIQLARAGDFYLRRLLQELAAPHILESLDLPDPFDPESFKFP